MGGLWVRRKTPRGSGGPEGACGRAAAGGGATQGPLPRHPLRHGLGQQAGSRAEPGLAGCGVLIRREAAWWPGPGGAGRVGRLEGPGGSRGWRPGAGAELGAARAGQQGRNGQGRAGQGERSHCPGPCGLTQLTKAVLSPRCRRIHQEVGHERNQLISFLVAACTPPSPSPSPSPFRRDVRTRFEPRVSFAGVF